MTQTDKAALTDRLSNIGMVTPTLAEGQPDQIDNVRDIPTLTEYIGQQLAIGGEAAINAGIGLIEAKQQLKHGEWQDWLAENFGLSDRQARRLMKLAQNYGDSKRTPVSVLGQRKALALLALPESEREEFLSETHQVNGEEKTVIDMTSRELEKAIKERDEARKAAEQAQADTRAAQEARRSMEESLKTTNEILGRAREDQEAAASKAIDLEKQLAELKAAPVDVAVMEVDRTQLDAARAEGEAAKAEEIAALQAQLDKAKASKEKSDEKRKNAEAAVDILKLQLAEAAKAKEEAVAQERKKVAVSDPDVIEFKAYYEQFQDLGNKMCGVILKVQRRGDQTSADNLSKAVAASLDKIRGYLP